MIRNKTLMYWAVILVLALIALIIVAVANSRTVQALGSDQALALQATPPASTVVVPTIVITSVPPVTIVPPTVIVPQTGGDIIFVDFFSNWVLWAVLGIFLIILLIALVTRPGGPGDTHHHHDL